MMRLKNRNVEIFNLLVTVVFFLCLFVPFVISSIQFAQELLSFEKRSDAQSNIPARAASLVINYARNPNSGLIYRTDLIRWMNIFKVKYLGYKQINQVVIGKDGWLFVDDHNSMKDHMGLIQLGERELLSYKKTLEYRRDFLAKLNIPLLLVVAPNKETIYPEYLPDGYNHSYNISKLDQIINYLKANSNIEIVDLRTPLLKAKEKYPVYYMTDSHWNSFGSFIASAEIMKKLDIYFPGNQACTIDDLRITVDTSLNNRDLSGLILMGGLMRDYEVALTPLNNIGAPDDKKIHHAVIYHDSFYIPVDPWLSPYFRTVREFKLGEDPMFDGPFIQQEKPDIVIYVMVERLIGDYLTYYP